MATQPTDEQKDEKEPATIHARVDRSLFSFAVGQIKIQISRTPRPSSRDKLRELMPNACQHQIDWLLERAHFTQRELYWSCKQQGLVAPEGVLRQSRIAGWDYVWSLTFAIFAGFGLLACLLFLAGSPPLGLGLQLIGMSAVLGAVMCGALVFGVWPHVTARKAVRALANKSEGQP